MRQFISSPDQALADLGRRARGRCLLFTDQELPPGAVPRRGRVGFEIGRAGEAVIYVEKGIAYDGASPSIRRWFAEGELRFDTFGELCRWLRTDLAEAYGYDSPAFSVPGQQGLETEWPSREECLPLVGRDAEIEQAEAILGRRHTACGVLFTGPPGVGKTAVLRELAWRWQERGAGHVACRMEPAAVMTGTAYPAEKNDRLRGILEGARTPGSSVLIAIEDLLLLCAWPSVVSTGYVAKPAERLQPDLVSIRLLASAIDAGVRVCAAASLDQSSLMDDPVLQRRLHIIELDEPTEEVLIHEILPVLAPPLETSYGVEIARECLATAARQSRGGGQPAAAIAVLERALVRAHSRKAQVLGPDDVLDLPAGY